VLVLVLAIDFGIVRRGDIIRRKTLDLESSVALVIALSCEYEYKYRVVPEYEYDSMP